MPSFYDQLDDMSEEKLAEYERVTDNFTAAGGMEEGPEQDAALEAVYQDAKAIDLVMLMAGARCYQVISLFNRREYAQGLRHFVPTMDLVAERGDEIPDPLRTALETLVLAPLDAMVDNPDIPRTTIEAFLGQLETESRSRPAAATNYAFARAFWHSHTGERSAFEDWFDRWATSASDWWSQNKTMTISITGALLDVFDPQEALAHLERRSPTMVGDPDDRRDVLVTLAGTRSMCGNPDQAWKEYRQLLMEMNESELPELVERARTRSLVCAAVAAPWDSDDPAVSTALHLIESAERAQKLDTADAIEDTAALAEHHLRRGDTAAGTRWRSVAEERARAFDARNGNTFWSTRLATRWFHDL
ncbi:hypothetical protein FB566_1397 [Stackebrandtia endophytica]|uniref:Tetratricopeptide repeat protein n=1 Tax=Stackebrandtia endophytica TaxID=1496996 RepID=A0A543ATG7_9ACTN|nr:hypothetical protein [Stackebrandtia endophytica]TQL75881.1 hypothetical protein FB566_1397 [Stackebrandtia endophytica]